MRKSNIFLKVGHRGARAYEVENTLKSFQRAIELGVNAIEFDVRSSGDGKLIVFHDDNLERIFGSYTPVNQTTLRELKDISGKSIPTLSETLRFINASVEKILIELKETGQEKQVLSIIKKAKMQGRAIVISFHEQALSDLRQLDPRIETGLIYSKHSSPVAAALRLNAQYLVPLYKNLNERTVENAHKAGLKVIAWTINSEKNVRKFKSMGVDGIASDKPDIL